MRILGSNPGLITCQQSSLGRVSSLSQASVSSQVKWRDLYYTTGITVSLICELTDVNNLALNVAHSNHLINTSFLVKVLLIRKNPGRQEVCPEEKGFVQWRGLCRSQRSCRLQTQEWKWFREKRENDEDFLFNFFKISALQTARSGKGYGLVTEITKWAQK